MDIGSLICTHKNPQCEVCPFEALCQGKVNPLDYPEKKKKKKTKEVRKRTLVIYHKADRYALAQNEARLLSGLWAFRQEEDFEMTTNMTMLGAFKHHYTHFTLEAWVVLVQNDEQESYFTIEQIHELALSGADRKALALLQAYT